MKRLEIFKTYVLRVGESTSRVSESSQRVQPASRRVARIVRVQNPYRTFRIFGHFSLALDLSVEKSQRVHESASRDSESASPKKTFWEVNWKRTQKISDVLAASR